MIGFLVVLIGSMTCSVEVTVGIVSQENFAPAE